MLYPILIWIDEKHFYVQIVEINMLDVVDQRDTGVKSSLVLILGWY